MPEMMRFRTETPLQFAFTLSAAFFFAVASQIAQPLRAKDVTQKITPRPVPTVSAKAARKSSAQERASKEAKCAPKPLGLTVSQALAKYGGEARARIKSRFEQAGVQYPPKQATMLSLKKEQLLLLFAKNSAGKWAQVAAYPYVSWSGELGPKLAEGDLQIPEGFYKPTRMDANTHLCLWVDYPNPADRKNAAGDRRTKLGGDIQIHEGVFSTGCIVISHDDMADLFVLAQDCGCANLQLLMAPCNLVAAEPGVDFSTQPKWLPGLYRDLKKSLASYPIDTSSSHPITKQN